MQKQHSTSVGECYNWLEVVAWEQGSKDVTVKCHVARGKENKCGTTFVAKLGQVVNGNTQSCGCLRMTKYPGNKPISKLEKLAYHMPWVKDIL